MTQIYPRTTRCSAAEHLTNLRVRLNRLQAAERFDA
jgi:hypothetical protein